MEGLVSVEKGEGRNGEGEGQPSKGRGSWEGEERTHNEDLVENLEHAGKHDRRYIRPKRDVQIV